MMELWSFTKRISIITFLTSLSSNDLSLPSVMGGGYKNVGTLLFLIYSVFGHNSYILG